MISTNPATGAVIWEGEESSTQQLKEALKRAKGAFPSWSNRDDRASFLHAYASKLQERRDELALAISEEMGKPLWESHQEVEAMIGKIALTIEAEKVRAGEAKSGSFVLRHRPHGVVAIFGPFNFPGHLPHGHIAPALLAGNTLLFKPSDKTPRVGELITEMWDLPDGVLQCVQGGAEVGRELAQMPIDGLFFTGSAAVGEQLRTLLDPTKILALEMGGNNPLVIWDCEQIEAAAYTALVSAFLTSGQRCTCARRLIIPDNEKIIEALIDLIEKVKVGPYTEEPFMGPVINPLPPLNGKAILDHKQLGEKLFTPALFEDPDAPDEECFGPRLRVIRVPTFEAAIAEANNTRFGLAAGLISDNADLWVPFRQQVRAGVINFNTPTTGASSALPFGGVGASGNHHPSAFYAADYCSYPVASNEQPQVTLTPYPGIAT